MLGGIHCYYPLGGHGHHHAKEDDNTLDFEWQFGTLRYKQWPRGHITNVPETMYEY
jgi:hypothetical protein